MAKLLGGRRGLEIIIVASAFTACATPESRANRVAGYPAQGSAHSSELSHPSPSDSEMSSFHDIEALFSKNLYDAAKAKMSSFSQRFPHSSLLPSVENLNGLLYLRAKRPSLAIPHFARAIELSPLHSEFRQYMLFNLATAQFETGLIEDANTSLSRVQVETLDKPNQVKVHFLKASIYDKKASPLDASRELLLGGRLIAHTDSSEIKRVFHQRIDQTLHKIIEIPSLEGLYTDFEYSSVADAVLFRLGSAQIETGNVGTGETTLRKLMTAFPQSVYFSQASDLLSRSQAQAHSESRSVGILLPLKGKLARFGAKSLQGIQLAFGIFNSTEPDTKIELIIEDSGEEPEQAIQALNRLVEKHHVVAVIGPMLSKGIDLVSQRAQQLGVPLFSLARRAAPALDYVFQGGLTQQIQSYEIARHAVQQLGIRKFAILYPNEKLGIETGQSFWDAVESMGGKVVGIESYNPEETDFRLIVDKLSGLYYTEARQRELELLAEEREANNIKKRTRKTEQFFRLKPIVDYDAVFIADDARVAGQILPTFAYRDVEHVKFLGTSAWNSPDFLARAQSYGEHACFVDAYFAESSSPAMRRFAEKYKKTFNQDPSSLEALAYDAAHILKGILTSSSHLSRSDVKDRLKSIHDFEGATGKISYKDGQFFRNLTVIKVKNGKFQETGVKESG